MGRQTERTLTFLRGLESVNIIKFEKHLTECWKDIAYITINTINSKVTLLAARRGTTGIFQKEDF